VARPAKAKKEAAEAKSHAGFGDDARSSEDAEKEHLRSITDLESHGRGTLATS